MKKYKNFITIIFLITTFWGNAQNEGEIIVKPKEYQGALRNPLKGFTTINVQDHPWGSVSHTYIRWNEIENDESDGIDKIINVSNQKWKNAAAKNMKIIPRVYLHWDGDQKYWPADMQTGDYSSEQFKERVLRLIQRLGICWDNDPRVAFIEMGIIGKWGEHHSPSPTPEMQKLIGDAFAAAFKNKKVSVRHFWNQFTDHPFGEYWDSWAHYDQMWGHGNSIKEANEKTGRYKETYIGGEVAYNWGSWEIQPGATPTHSVAIQKHRDFVINSIRWLHCTQLRWIDGYDKFNAEAIQGAKKMQKAFGYRYILDEVRFSLSDSLKISFDVTNTGSAPFYYNWPVEVALLDSLTRKPVWKATIKNTDIRNWLPGEGWTDPDWKYVGSWQEYLPNENWNSSGTTNWSVPPAKNTVEEKFKIDSLKGTYILSLSVLDPAGNVPSVRFATENYFKGGRHPVGKIDFDNNRCYPLPIDYTFDDPALDNTLHYSDEMDEIVDTTVVIIHGPTRKTYNNKSWKFPGDSILAWQADYFQKSSGDTLFSMDSAQTIGVYGCNDTTGLNIRSYADAGKFNDAAQFNWNNSIQTFQKNGQWLEYSANFDIDEPYQLLLLARNNVDANFKLTISNLKGDTVFFKDINLNNDFEIQGGGNEQTDWLLSKFPLKGLWGGYVVRFDWYDNVGEPGVFGGFSFIKSNLDFTPPNWYYVSVGIITSGTDIIVMTTEAGKVYLVPAGTATDTSSIKLAAVAVADVTAYSQSKFQTSGLVWGDYVVYALDNSKNISEASRLITIQYPVNAPIISNNSMVSVIYNPIDDLINIKSTSQLKQVDVYNILGKKVGSKKCEGNEFDFQTAGILQGIYLVQVFDKSGTLTTKKIFKR